MTTPINPITQATTAINRQFNQRFIITPMSAVATTTLINPTTQAWTDTLCRARRLCRLLTSITGMPWKISRRQLSPAAP